MSTISELVKKLRNHAQWEYLVDRRGSMLIQEAANVIEEMSEKLLAANMERSSQYGDGGWIPCEEQLPEVPESNPDFEGKPLEVYLVVTSEEKYPFRAFWNGKFFADGLNKINNVTHWRSLPDLSESYKEVQHGER